MRLPAGCQAEVRQGPEAFVARRAMPVEGCGVVPALCRRLPPCPVPLVLVAATWLQGHVPWWLGRSWQGRREAVAGPVPAVLLCRRPRGRAWCAAWRQRLSQQDSRGWCCTQQSCWRLELCSLRSRAGCMFPEVCWLLPRARTLRS